VPTDHAHHPVTALGGIEDVRIVVGTEVVATHKRCWTKEEILFDPRHYLALLERKPGALDFARPLENWNLPACFALLRRRLEADLGSIGTREYIKVLRLMEKATVAELAGAIEVALSIGATSADAITLILFHRQERPSRAVQPGWPPTPQVGGRGVDRSRRLRRLGPEGGLSSAGDAGISNIPIVSAQIAP